MNQTEKNELLKRLSALEVAVGRLMTAMGGMQGAMQAANEQTVLCGKCEGDPTEKTLCNDVDCPQGLYTGLYAHEEKT